MNRAPLAASAAVAVMLLMLFVPSASADSSVSTVCDGVTVMTFADGMDIDVLDDTNISIYVHNANSVPVMIKLTQKDSGPVRATMPDDMIIDAGATVTLTSVLAPNDFIKEDTYGITLTVEVIKDGSETGKSEMTFTVNTSNRLSSNGYYMTVMGLFTLPEPFNNEYMYIALTIIGWLAVAIVASTVGYIVVRALGRLVKEEDATINGGMFAWGVFIMILATGTVNLARVMGTSYKFLASLQMVMDFVYIFAGAMVALDIYKAVVAFLLKRADKYNTEVNSSLIPLTHLLGKILIILIAVTYILSKMGINLASILAGAGVATLGITLGAKPVINQFFSGFILLITRPFVKDDIIKVNGSGALTVDRIGIMNTTFITGYSNDKIVIPNSTLTSNTINNISWTNKNYRSTLKVRVPIDCDVTLAKKLIKEAAEENPNVLGRDGDIHDPVVVISDTNDHGAIVLTLACYFRNYGDSFDDMGIVRETVLKKFAENGIHIPGHRTITNIMGDDRYEE